MAGQELDAVLSHVLKFAATSKQTRNLYDYPRSMVCGRSLIARHHDAAVDVQEPGDGVWVLLGYVLVVLRGPGPTALYPALVRCPGAHFTPARNLGVLPRVYSDHEVVQLVVPVVPRVNQHAFLDSEVQGYRLYTGCNTQSRDPAAVGGRRADLVAVHEEGEEEDHEMTIYVGEIKSAAKQYYAPGRAYVQLDTYIADLRRTYPEAVVAPLTSWNPDAGG